MLAPAGLNGKSDPCLDPVADDVGCLVAMLRRVLEIVFAGKHLDRFVLRADCVDVDRFQQFYLNHIGLGPEQLCAAGSDFGGVQPCQ